MEANILLLIFGIIMLVINCYFMFILKKLKDDKLSLHYLFGQSEKAIESRIQNQQSHIQSQFADLESIFDKRLRESAKLIQDDLSLIQYQLNNDLEKIKSLHQEDHLNGPQIILEDFSLPETLNQNHSNHNDSELENHVHSNGHSSNQNEISDLCEIKGIGNIFEQKLKDIGICDLFQVSQLTTLDIETIAEHLNIRKEKIINENWVGQARELVSTQNTA